MDVPFGAPPPMTVLPPGTKMRAAPDYRPSGGDFATEMDEVGYMKFKPDAFQSWLDALPERHENIEDRRPAATEAKTMEQLTPEEQAIVKRRIEDVAMAFGGGKL